MSQAVEIITVATALGCGLVAGVLFAFSTFVMPALGRLPAPQGIAAMQSINVLAVTPMFMTALFGTAAACLGLAIWAAVSWDVDGAPWALGGGALYLAGTIAVTMAANVPRNNDLAALRADAAEAATVWERYLREWTAWNHLRTVAALAAAALLIVAVIVE
jgi:uncharacterized membrane protein